VNKRGNIWELIAGVIVFLIVTGGLLMIYFKVYEASQGQVTTPVCFVSATISDVFTIGTIKTVEWRCPIDGPIKITADDLKKKPNFGTMPDVTEQKYGGKEAFTGKTLYEYNANKIVAQELKKCYIKSGYGNSSLFGQWWIPLGWTQDDKIDKNNVDAFVS
jgi:hypothetical protein